MERRSLVLLVGSVFFFDGFVTATSASACSVCLAGDPIYTAQGATAQQVGDIGVALQVRGWVKRSGVLPHEDGADDHDDEHDDHEHEHADEGDGFAEPVERDQSRRLDLFLSWAPLDRLTLSVDLPWSFNRITEREEGQQETASLSGLGDITFFSSVVLWRNREVLPSTWIEGRAFLKTPTGPSKQRVDGRVDPHLQTGTGSWDFGFGLAGAHRLEWGSLYASGSYRINTEGSLEYEYGDVALFTAALEVPLGHATGLAFLDALSPGVGLDFRWAAKDQFQNARYGDSGGSVLYATPSLRVRLPWPWQSHVPSLQGSVQIPTTSRWLFGDQDEKPIWQVGLQVGF